MRRVMIATPAHDGCVDVHYADSLAGSIKDCALHEIDLCPVYWPGEALVQRARDELVKIALEAGVDDVIFIDADQGWSPHWIARLLAYPVDVVGGAVRKKCDDELYNVKASSIVVDRATELLIVDGVGTGFLRVSRKALEAAWASSARYVDKGVPCRAVFELQIDDTTEELIGEDVGFCRKLRAAGFRIHVDTGITCSHVGRKAYTGDFSSWLKRYCNEQRRYGDAA